MRNVREEVERWREGGEIEKERKEDRERKRS
jgi:hypothetical protein